MSNVRFILVVLICGSPAALLADGLITQGIVAGIAAVALAITARSLRPGETEFLVSVIRPPAVAAAVPAIWTLIQLLPLRVLAHPIWKSAEVALGHPIAGAISVDAGASVVALGQYLSMNAVVFLSAAIAVDRQRAEWTLFALSVATVAIALILLTHDLFFPGPWLAALAREQAIDSTCLGTIIVSAACIRTIERYETRHSSQQRSVPVLLWTFAASAAALTICAAALILDPTYGPILAAACGVAALVCVMIIRRFGLRTWGIVTIVGPTLALVVLLVAAQPAQRGMSVPLAYSGMSAASLTALSERVLDDAPLVGTGAGTFAAIAPIYREMDDPPPGTEAATAAAAIAIELGKPMLWLIVTAVGATAVILLRASLRRGRDSFYPAMGGGCLISLLLLAFTNAGLFGTSTSLLAAAALGLAFAQSKGRTAQL